ncbi:TcdA/TcdB catalytic glycosyltransferase domain-containing protein [Serratia sp. PAMC26656]|uniref:TcdA/TcdB catalytic glycosyltransferase domain-containing protein n=1 Tax=Serratia sp. PAMC26656 TaxID=2775909 RepID=UPI003CEE4CB9
MRDFVKLKERKNKINAELKIKNAAFNYIFPRIKEGFNFDELVIEFLMENGIPYQRQPLIIEDSWFEKNNFIKKDVAELFLNDFDDFMRYYYYEIILRCNLASASDIVRLLVIYQYGGVYIDVDTLPYTDHIYQRLNKFIEREGIIENDSFLFFKTKLILKEIYSNSPLFENMLNYNEKEAGLDIIRFKEIKRLIELDIADFSLDKILPLGKLYVHENLLALGTLRRFKGIYFNNFISSHPKSRAIKIILITMKKRYRFLEKNNCIFEFYIHNNKPDCYMTRILTWRTELITRDYRVTSALTGPGLIIEVLLGLAYNVFKIGDLVEPSSLAEHMQNDEFGIALFQHNIYTPDGVYSTWRK